MPNKKVLILCNDKEGIGLVTRAWNLSLELLNIESSIVDYEDIKNPIPAVKRYPPKPGEEWEVELSQAQREKLSDYGGYILISFSQQSAALALWMLTLRGAQNIYGNKRVIIVDPLNNILKEHDELSDLSDFLKGAAIKGGVRKLITEKCCEKKIQILSSDLFAEVDHGKKKVRATS